VKQSPQNTALPSQQIRRTSFSSDTSKVGLKNVVSNFEIIGCGKESQICRFASFDIRNSMEFKLKLLEQRNLYDVFLFHAGFVRQKA